MIGRNFSRHDRFAEPGRAFDDHAVAPVANRIDRKHDAALVGLHHLLHDHRHPRVSEDGFLRAVEHRARREERGPAFAHTIENRIAAGARSDSFPAGRRNWPSARLRIRRSNARPRGRYARVLRARRESHRRAAQAGEWTRSSGGLHVPHARPRALRRRRGSS